MALARKSGPRQFMVELDAAEVLKGKGFAGDDRAAGKRGVTLLSSERWIDVIHQLDTVLPWHTRRANVLIQDMDLAATMGKRLRVGDIELHVWGETKPCALMDELHPGLRAVLASEVRGGVHAEVLRGGHIHVGDAVTLM